MSNVEEPEREPRWANMDGQLHFMGERRCCSILGRACPRCSAFVHVMPVYGGLMEYCETCDASAFNDPPAPEHDNCNFSPPLSYPLSHAAKLKRDAMRAVRAAPAKPALTAAELDVVRAFEGGLEHVDKGPTLDRRMSDGPASSGDFWIGPDGYNDAPPAPTMADRSVAEIQVAAQRLLKLMPKPSTDAEIRLEVLKATQGAAMHATMTLRDPALLAAVRESEAGLHESLVETMDWISIRTLAAQRVAELRAFAKTADAPDGAELADSNLERLQARIEAWPIGQGPRTAADVDAAGTIAHLRRRVAQLEKVIGDLTRTMKP